MTHIERFWFHVAEWIEKHLAHRHRKKHHHHKHHLRRISARFVLIGCS